MSFKCAVDMLVIHKTSAKQFLNLLEICLPKNRLFDATENITFFFVTVTWI